MSLPRLSTSSDHVAPTHASLASDQLASDSTQSSLSTVFGPEDVPLWTCTLGKLIDDQADSYGNRNAVAIPWQNSRLSYNDLSVQSKCVAKSLLEAGLKHGDCVGVMAGNCYQYVEVFLGASRIGCPVVVLNNTYSPAELSNALTISRCKILFMASKVGPRDLSGHISKICGSSEQGCTIPDLKRLVLFSGQTGFTSAGLEVLSYPMFISNGYSVFMNAATLRRAERKVQSSDVLNLQFTSGTTGAPKAAMLTHLNLINNGRLIGSRMQLTPDDIVCCPPPLFHCFGLVIGFLSTFTHGTSIIFPSDAFDANQVLDALMSERCTALLGVPTMFLAELEANKKKRYKITTVKTGLAAGSPVPMALMKRLEAEMGITCMLIAYGMTETSPVTLMSSLSDTVEKRTKTIGTIMAHTGAKIVDGEGNVVRRGVRGEICTSGYALQKGYWHNEAKTQEVMKLDEEGIRWMHTGDEGFIDHEGYCTITGRIKDIIIRGGENIFPVEIEEHLLAHSSINEASVVGLPDDKYGEVVACFLRLEEGQGKPSTAEVADFVSEVVGRHKAPKHVFWIGDEGVGDDYPKTGSGKHQKHILRAIGQELLKQGQLKAKL